jgi:hypothetical protein
LKKTLQDKYNDLAQLFEIDRTEPNRNVNGIVKEALRWFTAGCNTPAVWCYGKHTKMLMADFIFEMKNVKFIIDETYSGKKESGFSIISPDMIRDNGIDGIIISSFKYREEVKGILKGKFSEIKYLDIYDVLEKNEIILSHEYYFAAHPYDHYLKINEYNRRILKADSETEKSKAYEKLIREYVCIKDFRSAILSAEEYARVCSTEFYAINKLREIYSLQQVATADIADKNVLMLCIDGLRRKDLSGDLMGKMKKWLDDNACIFNNAYSVSTSTYESLIPAYSENADLRTKYFEKNTVEEKQCKFIRTAMEQGRNIYFYTDSIAYVDSDKISVTDRAQTASEKIWDFVLDAVEEKQGLFYIHILYESHYSYPNPYTKDKLVADGSSIMFDFLARNGEQLRTDYVVQHEDALKYLDDILFPLLSKIKARFVLYADHGNIVLPRNAQLGDISYAQVTFHEDLIQIPLVVKSPEMEVGFKEGIISLMDINDIVISLLKGEKYKSGKKEFIKIVRSEIYNPDFRYIYRKNKQERGLMAFEGFIFAEGYKLVVYSDGRSELYEIPDDRLTDDLRKKQELMDKIINFVTVTDRLEG